MNLTNFTHLEISCHFLAELGSRQQIHQLRVAGAYNPRMKGNGWFGGSHPQRAATIVVSGRASYTGRPAA